ncbi:MAG: 1-deoxy-D-xylulose-5-phosphate synthase, partial [Deltaproteobacteria bacterium]|nr:1-deoxy-D-xylulose-5-phosphate synthase [Deltaproteobacteria bacterium]
MEKILDRIETSHDVKKLDDEELGQLCRELREEIISTVS